LAETPPVAIAASTAGVGRGALRLAREPGENRELSPQEVADLLAASPEPVRPLLGLMLCGLTGDELAALRWDGVDFATRTIRVPGEFARELPLPEPLLMPFRLLHAAAGSELVAENGKGRPMSAEDLRTMVLCSAHDAAVQYPAEITPEVLRHTFVAHLLRQGIRFSDLRRMIGQLSAEALTRYGALVPQGQPRRGADEIDLTVPGLRAI
jgi:integrase